ncbi:MAG TPA: helix-turn-helix domain-containing protein [Mycobacteriales bacterium]|nr:helix-turn-helix domain-containing protein [Mycobacteriales bacterium]
MLEVVGLSETAEAVYWALVEGRPATAADLRAALPIEPGRLRDALRDLESNGLVSRLPGSTARYAAVAPDAALEVLFLEKEEQLRRARAQAARLAEGFHRAAGRDPAELVEVVVGRTAVLQRLEQIQRGAQHEYCGLDRAPYLQNPSRCTPANLNLHARKVSVRAIYDQSAVEVPGRLPDLEEGIVRGENARVLSSVPVKMVIADARIGLLPLQTQPAAIESAIVVHPSALLRALSALFEALWQQAIPLATLDGRNGQSTPDEPGTEARRILALLTAGLPDDAIARQLELSPKTIQRRIHEVMTRLGAGTRFQAGLQAAFRGWVTKPDDQRA